MAFWNTTNASVGEPLPTVALEQRMAPCPASPNCVSSYAGVDAAHSVKPIGLTGDPVAAFSRLTIQVGSMKRAQLVASDEGYRHFTFTTALMRFVDDLELELDGAQVHVRSASRVGHSDLGVNRKRVEAIRARFNKE